MLLVQITNMFCNHQNTLIMGDCNLGPTTYAHHAHTHTTHMHARVCQCTHYGRKGHLTKFYFDKINHIKFANKNVWVPIVSNSRGPKKIWAPKFSPLIFNVGVALT